MNTDVHCWRYNQFGNCIKCRDNNFMLWFYCSGFYDNDKEFNRILLDTSKEEVRLMSDCVNCKAVIFIDDHRYCEYDRSICHDDYDDSECEYFEEK